VAGEDREARTVVAVGEGDAGVIRHGGDDGGDAGDDFDGHARRREFLRLLCAPAENVGIAALESDDGLAGAGAVNEELVQLCLWHGLRTFELAPANSLGARRGQAGERRIDQPVVHDHVGAPEQFRAAQREQTGVARTRANKINGAFDFHGGRMLPDGGRWEKQGIDAHFSRSAAVSSSTSRSRSDFWVCCGWSATQPRSNTVSAVGAWGEECGLALLS
jgi:hypothetical protein